MNLLHITDYHFSNQNSLQNRVVNSIINTINDRKLKIDMIIFTGDLVQKGSKLDTFKEAEQSLFGLLSSKLMVDKENILFCPGNHDIDRESIHGAMKSYFERDINSNDDLNEFCKKTTDIVLADSLKPSNNYQSFLRNYHPENISNKITPFYSLHYRTLNYKKIAIVSLNSAWLSSLDKEKKGNDDKGNLLIPNFIFEDIKKQMGAIDQKILLIHHPLYFLKDYNFYSVENYIHNEFDLLFSGHVHKVSAISRHSGTNGIFEHVAKASLSAKENLGCSIIEVDEVEENKISVTELTYINDSDTCHVSNPIIHTVPCGNEKAEIIAFRRKIFDKIAIEKENANHLLLIKEDETKKDFLSLYNHPVLKKDAEGGLESKNSIMISLDDIVYGNENFVILGKDKCGKTSLLRRIQIEILMNHSRNCKIPFFVDAKDFESKIEDNFELEQYIRSYFSINKNKTSEILKSNNFLLLIDNYSLKSPMSEYLNKFLLEYPNVSFVICSEYNVSRSVDVFQLGNTIYEKLFFHDLRRKEIIAYTDKRLSSNQNKEAAQEKIITLCKQLELPLNYWTVSLLLLIYNKSSDSYSKNIFSILDICVDEIFGKKQLLLTNRIGFDQLKTICAELAKELFENHELNIYSAPFIDILNKIDKILLENPRINAQSRDVFDFFVNCGILKQKKENNYYVFRLNGFFEYFLAYQMTRDSVFLNDILSDDKKYLGFKNQIEVYCGFKRDDFDFLKFIFDKTEQKLNSTFTNYDKKKDVELIKKVKEPEHLEAICREVSVKKTLDKFEKAEIEDITDELQINSEVHHMKVFDPNIINTELIEQYLSILARSFRNLDGISGKNMEMKEIFHYILDSYCNFGYFLIDEFSNILKKEIKKENFVSLEEVPELDLLRLISNFCPMITQSFLFDGIGHYNLERLIIEEISNLEQDSKNNQYKLFMLYYLLLDIDLNANREYIEISMSNIKMPVLKYAIYLKLNYYLAFKGGENKSLQQSLTKSIQEAKLNFDKESDIGDIQKQIQNKKRLSTVKKLD